jgi:hypothetical protein
MPPSFPIQKNKTTMRTDGVIFGITTPYGDHTHLDWVCPDCGSSGSVGDEYTRFRFLCSRTGRGFLVVGIADESATDSGHKRVSRIPSSGRGRGASARPTSVTNWRATDDRNRADFYVYRSQV